MVMPSQCYERFSRLLPGIAGLDVSVLVRNNILKICKSVGSKSKLKKTMTQNIQEKIEQERDEARKACDISGPTSKECAAAWDSVEELQAEASHQNEKKPKTPFQNYCDENPEAVECRIDDN